MTIYSKVQGQGEPLILIHGLFGSLENLGALARIFAEHFTVYSLDLPNHGRSAHSSETNLSLMVDQLERWIDETGLEKVNILGHSLGGKLAMEFALLFPERVSRLVVMDIAPVHYDPHHNQVFAGLKAIDLASLKSRTEADGLMLPYVEELAVRSFLLKNLQKAPEGGFTWRMNLRAIDEGYPELIRENAAGAVFEGETLFLKGGNSDYIKEVHRNDIVQRFPNVSLKVVANTGHWLHAEKPEVVARLATKFLL